MRRSPQQTSPSPDQGGRWGLLGGGFDPIHNGHLTLAEGICQSSNLDGIVFIPAFNPPHKEDQIISSFDDRMIMLNLALVDYPHFIISDIEKDMELPGYTLNVVRAIKTKYPAAGFTFLIGADNIENMKLWYKPDEIVQEIDVLAGARPGYELRLNNKDWSERISLVTTPEVNISASEIRAQIKTGLSEEQLSTMVPEMVARYIMEKELYR